MQKGVDWTIYAQKRSAFSDIFEQSVDGFELLDVQIDFKQLTPSISLEKSSPETTLEKTASEIVVE